ncbi:MAG: hypothetical protein ACYTBZ_09895 [Planctomycetota bacterium]|jgi:predicted GH43/DUF377 family glycosyl hydrolase
MATTQTQFSLNRTAAKIKFLSVISAVVCVVSGISCSQTSKRLCALETMFPAKRYIGNPIILHGGGWKDSQVMEPCIVDDPEDPNRLVMFFASMAAPVAHGVMSIGAATATKDNPYQWCEDANNPLMRPGAQGQWDDKWIRLDSVVPLGGTKFRIYYTGCGIGTGIQQIGTAVCTKQGKSWVFERDEKNPILMPSGDEKVVSQAAVINDGGRWYMHYSYRTATRTLPGIRLAVSDDGINFTKPGTEILSVGPEGTFDSLYIEWHQFFKIDTEYVELYEAYNGKNWSIGMACSKNPACKFTKSVMNPVFEKSGAAGSFDKVHVATPAVYRINGRWLLFYSGANLINSHVHSYSYSNWDMGIAELRSPNVFSD